MKYYVYILYSESADSFYKGQTSNLEERLIRHNEGKEKATKRYALWRLIWSTSVDSRVLTLPPQRSEGGSENG